MKKFGALWPAGPVLARTGGDMIIPVIVTVTIVLQGLLSVQLLPPMRFVSILDRFNLLLIYHYCIWLYLPFINLIV